MAYNITDTNWKFKAPQAGETDSAEEKANTLKEVDAALLDPGKKAQLTSRGANQSIVSTSSSAWYDATFVLDSYTGKYVTQTHNHPTPANVPHADKAADADHAEAADNALIAAKLSPGFSINGHHTDGATDATVRTGDVPDYQRHFYGTVDPSTFGGFPAQLREGDIYVKYTE